MAIKSFLDGGGEMGKLMRSADWSATPLGNPDKWPPCLKTLVSVTLHNKIGMYIAWGPEFIQIYNDAYLPILGSSKHPKALGTSTRDTFAEIWNIIGPMFSEVMTGNSVGFADFMLPLDRDGYIEECFFDFSYSPVFQEDGTVGGVLVTVIETTDKVKASREVSKYISDLEKTKIGLTESQKFLYQSEHNLRNLVMSAPVAMAVFKEPDHIVEIINSAMIAIMGRTHEEVIKKPVFEAFPEAKEQGLEKIFTEVYTRGISFSAIERPVNLLEKGTLTTKYLTFIYEPFREGDGSITGIINVALDVTEQVEARLMIEDNESNLRNLVRNAPVAMCVLKTRSYIVEIANDPMFELWGVSSSQVMKKPIFDALPEAREQGLEALLDNVYNTGQTFSAKEHPLVLPRNGILQTTYVNFTYEPFREENGSISGIIAVAINVTEQVLARLRIEEAEERARLAIESANIGTFDLNLITDQIITSDRFNSIFGFDQGSSHTNFLNLVHPDDFIIRDKAYEEADKTGKLSYQVRLIMKDETIKWIRVEGRMYSDANHIHVRLIGTVLDITAMKDIQRQKDDFLAIASHELKTPLTSIKGYTQILTSLFEKGEQRMSLDLLKKTERQVDKMINLIYNFLDISKLENSRVQLKLELFDVNELITETINSYNYPGNGDRFQFLKGIIPKVNADKAKIEQVIDNFINNALKYSNGSKLIVINTTLSNNEIVVSVADSGVGINDSSKEKIFQRFYRADNVKDESASGFGIGLYFSSEVIRLHRGRIWFESKEDEGSVFYFSLPLN